MKKPQPIADVITGQLTTMITKGAFEDRAPERLESAREALSQLWDQAQELPEEQKVLVSQAIITCYEQTKAMQQTSTQQSQLFRDAADVLTGIIEQLRCQRDLALNDLDRARLQSNDHLRQQFVYALALELNIPQPNAERVFAALIGEKSDVYISDYTMMDVRDALRQVNLEIEEDLEEQQAIEDEYQREIWEG